MMFQAVAHMAKNSIQMSISIQSAWSLSSARATAGNSAAASASKTPRATATRRSSIRTRRALFALDAEQAGGTEEQHRDEDGEEQNLRHRRLRPYPDDALDHAEGSPPSAAPGMLPSPPRTTMTKAFSRDEFPSQGWI